MQAGDLGFLTTTTVDFERKNTELFGRNELIIPFLFGPLKGRIPVELRMHRVSLLHSLIRYLHCHIQHVPRGLARLAHADCLHPARTLCCRRRRGARICTGHPALRPAPQLPQRLESLPLHRHQHVNIEHDVVSVGELTWVDGPLEQVGLDCYPLSGVLAAGDHHPVTGLDSGLALSHGCCVHGTFVHSEL